MEIVNSISMNSRREGENDVYVGERERIHCFALFFKVSAAEAAVGPED